MLEYDGQLSFTDCHPVTNKAISLYSLLANDAEQYLFTHYQMNQLYISKLVIEQGG